MPDLESLPDGAVIADGDGLVERVNTMGARMLRVPAEELVARHVRDALPLDDRQGNNWYDMLRPYDGYASRTGLVEQSWFTPWGAELLMTGRLIRDQHGGPLRRLVLSLRDGHARARRDRERSDLLATAAHELRSPLTGVKGFTSTLRTKWDRFSDEQRQLMLETVDSDADRLARLISELLDAARIDSGRLTLRPGPVDVAKLVQRVLDLSFAGRDHTPRAQVADGLPTVWADGDRLAQVVTNLVENAIQHGHGLESVTVRAPGDGRDGLLIEVTDNGTGIPPENRSRIFTRFWKAGERGGSGLGLFIVNGVVEGHGGSVTIDDDVDGGARIVVWLPENEPEALHD